MISARLAPLAVRSGVCFRLQDHDIIAVDGGNYVMQIHRQPGHWVIAVWDDWKLHCAAARQSPPYRWQQIEYLPDELPEPNFVELVWNQMRHANVSVTSAYLHAAVFGNEGTEELFRF